MGLLRWSQVADGLVGSCGGVLRGQGMLFWGLQMWLLTVNQGRQHLGALFNVVAYYVLALPVGLTLSFHPRTHLGLQGLWIGTFCLHFIEYMQPSQIFEIRPGPWTLHSRAWRIQCCLAGH